MGVLRSAILLLTLGTALAFSATDASAQMFNQPFSFTRSTGQVGSGSSVGMSTAYRQLILQRELLGRAADNPLVRDYSGALLDVQRGSSGQAFLSIPSSSFIGGRGFDPTVYSLGFAYGLGTSGGDSSSYGFIDAMQATPVYDVMASWISSIDARGGMQGASHPSGAASMDAWISQLYLL